MGRLSGLEILVLEDEVLWRRELVASLEASGAEVMAAGTLSEVENLREPEFRCHFGRC